MIDGNDFFDIFDEDDLLEIVINNPSSFKKLCILISLDIQLEIESNAKEKSN
tara:strand:+ start:2571 stop:2726 length:156 start_codon:yes stop_codon:yes gene_type:complete